MKLQLLRVPKKLLIKKKQQPSLLDARLALTAVNFAGTLAGVVAETKAHIYFINSEEPSQLDALQDFRSRYEIPTVPGFVHVENGEIKVRCDSSMSAQEIKEFAGL